MDTLIDWNPELFALGLALAFVAIGLAAFAGFVVGFVAGIVADRKAAQRKNRMVAVDWVNFGESAATINCHKCRRSGWYHDLAEHAYTKCSCNTLTTLAQVEEPK